MITGTIAIPAPVAIAVPVPPILHVSCVPVGVHVHVLFSSEFFPGFQIRIRMDPHYFELLDPDPDPGGQK
jgi:hypothetical protein